MVFFPFPPLVVAPDPSTAEMGRFPSVDELAPVRERACWKTLLEEEEEEGEAAGAEAVGLGAEEAEEAVAVVEEEEDEVVGAFLTGAATAGLANHEVSVLAAGPEGLLAASLEGGLEVEESLAAEDEEGLRVEEVVGLVEVEEEEGFEVEEDPFDVEVSTFRFLLLPV